MAHSRRLALGRHAIIIAATLLACASSDQTRSCPKGSKTLEGRRTPAVGSGWEVFDDKYIIQQPYDRNDRFTLGGSTYKFKVKADDAPFKKGSDTAPRTELATCTDYTEGLHQFAAMVTIPEGTDKVAIFQIKLQAPDDIHPNTFMLIVDDGKLVTGPTGERKVVAANIYDRQLQLNVIYDADRHTAEIYVHGELKHTQKGLFDGEKVEVYFKCGVYARSRSDSSSVMMAIYEDITIYKRVDNKAASTSQRKSQKAGQRSSGCSDRQWKTGTLTVYNNLDEDDDPNAGSLMEFERVTNSFLENVPVVSIHGDRFWKKHKYHNIYVCFKGREHVLQVWDGCRNADCPGKDKRCCDNNIKAVPGSDYLLDVETRTLQRLWDEDGMDVLEPAKYAIGDSFDPNPIAKKYGAKYVGDDEF